MTTDFIGLLKQRKFLPLFLTQFFGAFNDNAYKLAMLTMISYHFKPYTRTVGILSGYCRRFIHSAFLYLFRYFRTIGR